MVSRSGRLRKGRRVDLGSYAATLFVPHLFCGPEHMLMGCGASALALLTGVPPARIARENGSRHYSDRFMLCFLRERGFRTLRLTHDVLARAQPKLEESHVLLLSQQLTTEEGTWGILHRDVYYHNFQIYYITSLSLINKPLLSAYVLCHPFWRAGHAQSVTGLTPKQKHLALTPAGLRTWIKKTVVRREG